MTCNCLFAVAHSHLLKVPEEEAEEVQPTASPDAAERLSRIVLDEVELKLEESAENEGIQRMNEEEEEIEDVDSRVPVSKHLITQKIY